MSGIGSIPFDDRARYAYNQNEEAAHNRAFLKLAIKHRDLELFLQAARPLPPKYRKPFKTSLLKRQAEAEFFKTAWMLLDWLDNSQ